MLQDLAKSLMEVGWKLREGQKWGPHWLQFAFAPFFLFLSAVIFHVRGDFYGYSESIDHMVYWFKIASRGLLVVGARLGNRALDTMREHRPEKRTAAIRALISVHVAMGNYAHALSLIEEYLTIQTSPLDHADMLSHKASCLLASGFTLRAMQVAGEVVKVFERVPEADRNYHWVVWYTRALLVQSQCLFAQHKFVYAKEIANLTLDIATFHKAHVRVVEANSWIEAMEQILNS